MEFIPSILSEYCENFTSPESELLKDLNRQTHLKASMPRMLSGHLQGRLLSFVSKMLQPQRILEIGTYTGYSALCLAEGLATEGKLYTIDSNEETNHFAKKFFSASAYSKQIELLEGKAMSIIPTLSHSWDLVFIDADKSAYSAYFDLVVDRVRSGGIIIADNVLWSGKVLQETKDRDTAAIHAFNEKVSGDGRVESLLLPVRDGLMFLRKK